MRHRLLQCFVAGLVTLLTATPAWTADTSPQVLLPKNRLQAAEVAVIVNMQDPLSVAIADYYRERRAIPGRNVIRIAFAPGRQEIKPEEFAALQRQVSAATPAPVQAYVLTWAAPYRVGCMSVTSAFAFGFDPRWCSRKRCAPTAVSPYFDSASAAPFDDLQLRPTIALAAKDLDQARALIDRGIASDGSRPAGTAYLVHTTDKARNVRAALFPIMTQLFAPVLRTERIETDALRDRQDVLFYFTGRTRVDHLDSLRFLPGAVADHLTSTGGKLTDSRQMSSLRWLEAGATGSYGTVVEPCNLPGKFPNPGLLMQHYLRGETLIEAYWKSVQMPGEGIFIGEPLAAPFDFLAVGRDRGKVRIDTWSLAPGAYRLETAPSPVGPFRATTVVTRIGFPPAPLRLPDTGSPVLRLTPLRGAASVPGIPPAATPQRRD